MPNKVVLRKDVVKYVNSLINFYGVDELTGAKDLNLAVRNSSMLGSLPKSVSDWIKTSKKPYTQMYMAVMSKYYQEHGAEMISSSNEVKHSVRHIRA